MTRKTKKQMFFNVKMMLPCTFSGLFHLICISLYPAKTLKTAPAKVPNIAKYCLETTKATWEYKY